MILWCFRKGTAYFMSENVSSQINSSNLTQKPNLLFIQTDQQRMDTLGIYGNDKIRTPNLDCLAKKSFVFDSYYTTQPQCSPSRATMLTGLYPHSHGTWQNNIPLNKDFPTFVEMIEDNSYISGHFGKWHLGDEIFKQRGFSEFESTESGYRNWFSEGRDKKQLCGYSKFLVSNGIPCNNPDGHSRQLANEVPVQLSKAAYLAEKAIDFMERNQKQPFALYMSFLEPHNFADHHVGPPFKNHYDNIYDPEDMEIPGTFYEKMDPTVSFLKRAIRVAISNSDKISIAYPRTVEELKQTKARYWGLVTLIDEMVGRVLNRLSELGLEENTIIVFTSDHGEMMGDHRLMSKGTYEEAVKVPLLLSVPGFKDRCRRVATRRSQIDLVPTLLELMNQPRPPHLQGDSWTQHLKQGNAIPDRDVFFETISPPWLFGEYVCHGRGIVTSDGWKLVLSEIGDGELYNLNSDHKERENLYFQKKYQKQVASLRKKIEDWQIKTQDDISLDLNKEWPQARSKLSKAKKKNPF